MRRTAASLVVAALVMLAGCAGGIAGPNASGAQTDGESGTVQFYVSDEQNAISQFEHLNVTVTSVGFAQTAAADANASGEWAVESESESNLELAVDGNVTAGENVTVTVTQDGTAVANSTIVVSANDTETTVTTDANGTATVHVPADAEEFTVEAETDSDSEYGESEASLEFAYQSESERDDGEGDAEWVEHEVDNRTVDLTELQGANATLLGNMSVPAGEYEKVFVHVGEVEGTLKTGERVNVKLPSQKLHLNEDFTVNQSSDVEFVFDITVFEAGNSGKYILKPVASESGTDVPIERVDVEADDDEAELEANFVGNVTAGENATVRVTQDGEPVENATVTVNEDVTVTTDANGTATVHVPADAEEFELEASTSEDSAYGEAEAELEFELGGSDSEDGDDESDDGDSDAENETDSEVELGAVLEGSLAPGENATVVVTDGEGEAVEDATVAVDGDAVGETNADGELTFVVPEDVSVDTEVTVTADGETVTLNSTTAAAAN